MNEITTAAFFDELDGIQKEAGIVGRGLKALGQIMGGGGTLSRAAGRAGSARSKKTGNTVSRLGGHVEMAKRFWRSGADKASAAGKNRLWGGARRLMKSPYGAAAAVGTGMAAVPFAVGRMTAPKQQH